MSDLKLVYDKCVDHLREIETYFKPDVKITFIARTPYFPDRDFILSRDDLSEVIKALERRDVRAI